MSGERAMIPQHASSVDSDVIAAIEENKRIEREFADAATAFVKKYATGDGVRFFWTGNLGEGWTLTGIASDTKPTSGAWTTGPRGQGWRPFKSNPAHREMAAVRRRAVSVPGSPGIVTVPGPGFSSYWVVPSFFVHDGVAYMRYSMDTTEAERFDGDLGPQWTEIMPSAWHLASEAHKEASR